MINPRIAESSPIRGKLEGAYAQRLSVDDFDHTHLLSRGNGFAVGEGIDFVEGSVDRNLHLALAGILAGDAQIDVGCSALTVLDVEGAVGFKPLHLLLDEEEHPDEQAADGHAHQHEQQGTGDKAVETDACPSKADEEVDHVADGEERNGAAHVHRVAVHVAEVGRVEVHVHVVPVHAQHRQHHLNEKHGAGHQCAAPEHLLHPVEGCKPSCEGLKHIPFNFNENNALKNLCPTRFPCRFLLKESGGWPNLTPPPRINYAKLTILGDTRKFLCRKKTLETISSSAKFSASLNQAETLAWIPVFFVTFDWFITWCLK